MVTTATRIPLNPNPWPDVVQRRRRQLEERGRTFDYVQCRRALCYRWFPDERSDAEGLASWCPNCLARLVRAARKADARRVRRLPELLRAATTAAARRPVGVVVAWKKAS